VTAARYPRCAPGFCWARAWRNAQQFPELDYAHGWLTLAGSATSARPVSTEVRFRHAWNVVRDTGEIVDPSRPPLYPGESYRYEPEPTVPGYLAAPGAVRVRLLAERADRLAAGDEVDRAAARWIRRRLAVF
jgi:hypothetical protein